MAKRYRMAYECYKKCDSKYFELGCCEQKLGLFEEAADNFRKVKEFKRMIDNLERVEDKQHKIDILKKAGKFELKEYFYRIYMADYYRE